MLERVAEILSLDPVAPRISVSGGVAVFPEDGESPTILLRAADRKLYEAKGKVIGSRREAAHRRETQGMSGTLF